MHTPDAGAEPDPLIGALACQTELAASGDAILCPGVYAGFTLTGETRRIQGPGAVIDGTIVVEGGGELFLEGVTVRGGGLRCDGSEVTLRQTAFVQNPGAVVTSNCTLTVRNSRFEDNHAGTGGALRAEGTGSFRIEDSTFTANSAEDRGGAVYVAIDGILARATFTDNSAGNKGGALYVDTASPVVEDVVFERNSSVADGGAMFVDNSAAVVRRGRFVDNESTLDDAGGLRLLVSRATVEDCEFVGNRAFGDGGAIKVSHDGGVIRDSRFEGNLAAGSGGALEVDDDQSRLERLIVTGNQAARGGGIHGALIGSSDGWEELTVTGNVATEHGGGIYLEQNEGFIELTRSTITDNAAARGGGLASATTTFWLTRTVVARNTASLSGDALWLGDGTGADLDFVTVDGATRTRNATVTFANTILVGDLTIEGAAPTFRYSDLWQCSHTPGGLGNVAVDPGFAGAGDYHLGAGSPLVDAGDPALVDAADGSRADMGAYGGP